MRARLAIARGVRGISATAAGLLVLHSAGCFQKGCDDNLGGLHNGDRVQTTIVRELAAPPPNDVRPPTCGDLGDLSPGVVVQSSIALGGGDVGCYDRVEATPQSVSTGTLTIDAAKRVTLQLPNGCRGQFEIGFSQQTANGSFLDDNSNAATPSWLFFRTFTVEGDASACFPGVTPPSACADRFVATNRVVN